MDDGNATYSQPNICTQMWGCLKSEHRVSCTIISTIKQTIGVHSPFLDKPSYILYGCGLYCISIKGSLEVKLPTIWTDEKQRWEESAKRSEEERRSKKRKSQKKEDPGARKGRKVAKHCLFPMMCGSGGSKSRLAKAAGAEPAGQMRDGKLHAVVARSTFRCQNVQNTPTSDHFWKLRCRKTKKCTPFWREAHVEVKMLKHHMLGCRFAWQAQGIVHLVKSEQNVRVL